MAIFMAQPSKAALPISGVVFKIDPSSVETILPTTLVKFSLSTIARPACTESFEADFFFSQFFLPAPRMHLRKKPGHGLLLPPKSSGYCNNGLIVWGVDHVRYCDNQGDRSGSHLDVWYWLGGLFVVIPWCAFKMFSVLSRKTSLTCELSVRSVQQLRSLSLVFLES
jgi:hypothetical protein